MTKYICMAMLLLAVSCGGSSGGGNNGTTQTPAANPAQAPNPTQTRPVALPDVVAEADLVKIADILPTMYYVPQEKDVNCRGVYGGTTYNGSEKTNVLAVNGSVIATVCTRFYRHLLMEGTGILKDRGRGEITINYGGEVAGTKRYHPVERCVFGEGVRRNLCLLPYHTIAADNRVHKIGDLIYVPEADGLRLPDGSIHNGYFIVRDTGSAFNGVGDQRVDMFVGLDPDYNNAFQRAGFHHRRPMKAYKIKGGSQELVQSKLKDIFRDLY